ncbi:hypothetical protein ACFL2R_02150 [Patescibacteria group bacterium]
MNKGKCENCWDFNKCTEGEKRQCAAHNNDMGRECWFVSSFTFRHKNKESQEKCLDCEWFKKFNLVGE